MLIVKKIIGWITTVAIVAPHVGFAGQIPIDLKFQILSQGRVRDLADYLGLVFQYAVGVAGIFAVALIMWGGMKWIFAGGDTGKVGEAQKTIQSAVIGLILALGSYLLLNTINPKLVTLQVPALRNIAQVSITSTGFCPNTGEFAGKFSCGKMYALRDGASGTPAPQDLKTMMSVVNPQLPSCWGASCAAGQGGCWYSSQVRTSSTQAPYRCIDDTGCAASCEGIRDQALCDSDACTSKIKQRCWWKGGSCKPRIQNGEACDAGVSLPACPAGARCGDLTCADLTATCNGADVPDKCVKNGTIEKDDDCDRDQQCKSGKCNFPPGAAENLVVSGAATWGASKVGGVVGGVVGGLVGCVGGLITGPGVLATCPGAIAAGSSIGTGVGIAAGAGYYLYQTVRDGECE